MNAENKERMMDNPKYVNGTPEELDLYIRVLAKHESQVGAPPEITPDQTLYVDEELVVDAVLRTQALLESMETAKCQTTKS